ncbi:cyclopropane-fatty-acyl-phospholipid synthase family protein [Alteromonas ponticola]|uniref:Cyclopropane-fatty-acyl-phospholipid synthase family protein n=1 Tax=Alteromonas aquimaris TaxID=2998417 RepID=A0ABT3P5R0_9ALTE|nr:cyclopropane-fatty-acyl-phospholipid synthase family protein [Alteromonas aquimaris]MCW8107416.1 cyclopropane-fatty-acyl-phospholipid synthase family protein [Alteromonas aquimaris]
MATSENVINEIHTLTLAQKTYRRIFFKALSQIEFGEITIEEQGVEVASFGYPDRGLRACVNILSPHAYRHLLLGGSVASGETYMNGLWTSPDLTSVIRIFARNLPMLDQWEQKFKWLTLPYWKIQHFMNRNSQHQAKRNIEAHYDLGNRLYRTFLDDRMMYSAAIYPDTNATLDDAQQHKLHIICEKLQLSEKDHLLEIGTGWGGLAIYAAKNFGAKVTTTTISEEQHAYAAKWIEKEGLADKITLLKKDYRELTGTYTKLVSVEMIEAVGHRYLNNFVEKCSSLLKSDALMLLQCITIDDRRFDNYANSVDFIQKYIFPGGFLPSIEVLNTHFKRSSNLVIRDLHDIGLDYARTLNDWYHRFNQAKDELNQAGYDERFHRLWTYYLKYCEGGFLERTISTVQIVLAKPGFHQAIKRV